MNYQFISYLWFTIFSAVISIGLAVHAGRKRRTPGALPFFIAMLLVILWIIAQGLEFSSLKLSTKLFWANIQYISITSTPALYFILVLRFTGRNDWLSKRWLRSILITVPLIFHLLLWTNRYHELIRRNTYLDTGGPFPMVAKNFGPLFWVFAFYQFILIIISLALLAVSFRQKGKLYRGQRIFLFAGLLLPVGTTVLHISGIAPFSFDLTPPMFGFAGLLISYGIFRYRLFEVVPVARSFIFEEMNTAVIVMDKGGRTADVNPAALSMLGLDSKEVIGASAEKLFKEYPELLDFYNDGNESVIELVIPGDETPRSYEVTLTAMSDPHGNQLGMLVMAYDITDRKSAEELIRHMAFHDSLTGLPNRKFFHELFLKEIARAERNNENVVLAFIDLDGFKRVNDRFGHDAGDRFLCEVAARLKKSVRKSDITARFGGDEFVLIMSGLEKDTDIDFIAEKIFHSFESPVNIDGQALPIQASLGISVYPRDGKNLETLLKKADAAMYTAKQKGKNTYQIYS